MSAPLPRIVDYLRRTDEAIVDEVRPMRHGTALLTPSLPLVWQLNAVRVDDVTAGPEALVAAAEEALGDAGHRKLVVHDEDVGARLAGRGPSSGVGGAGVDPVLKLSRAAGTKNGSSRKL